MSLKERIDLELKESLKSGDKCRLNTIRSIRAAFLEKEVSVRVGGKAVLSDEQELEVLVSLAKKRRDAIEQFTAGNRADLAENEAAELKVIEEYLPAPVSDEEVESVIREIVARSGATSMKDMGKVMGEAMKALKGKADGTKVQNVVKSMLSA
ncbi:MAG: GatB/YqeY domain-containing protein [Chlorobiaceae bacterium]|nr:GatB/YqeY domain-containing protein [Chlorobiaceae bacterium]NTW74220.1 GatB/YqeY domain-containing protein [Chlorobiaceae bacterium]